MTLQIRLLGPLSILRDGQPISGLRSRKALALFVYLALTDQPVARAVLVDLIWPEQDEKRGRANLSWALNHLKTHLPGCISAERQAIQFTAPNNLMLDVHQLHEWLTVGDQVSLMQAVDLVQGELLAGFTLDGSPEFELWLVSERERLRQQAVQAVTTLIDRLEQSGRHADAIPYAEKWVALMPWREMAHRQLMRCYAAAGQREAALGQFAQCQRILEDELAVEPSAETVALYKQIRDEPQIAIATPRHNLTRPALPLIGRADELAKLTELIKDKQTRLVSLVGVGGVGKTRLATEFAWLQTTAASPYPDGVYFVPAVHLSRADALADAIAQVLSCPLPERVPPTTSLHNFLRRKRLLLIIDNFEQLLEAATLLSDLLEQAPNVTVVVTSQERLRISAETILPLHGLEVTDTAASKLFIYCAQQQDARFKPTADEQAAIDAICAAVDGNPLAIQLAATWVPLFTPSVILTEIEHDLGFIAADVQDIPARHRSLRAVFEHAWQHLSAAERKLLAKLAIFESDFSFKAAQAVATARPAILLKLVSRSLVEQAQEGRYKIHPLVRQFAFEQLRDTDGELLGQCQRGLAVFAAELLIANEASLRSDEREAMAHIKQEWTTVQAGWTQAHQLGLWTLIADSLRALDQFVSISTRTQDGLRLISDAVNSLPTDPELALLRGQLETRRGIYLARLADYDAARLKLEESLRLLGDDVPIERALALMGLASIARDQGKLELSMERNLQALALLEPTDAQFRKASCLNLLGMTASRLRELDSAENYYAQSVAIYHKLGSRWAITQPLNNLAIVAYYRKQFAQTQSLLAQNAEIYAELGDLEGQAVTLSNQATMAYETGDAAAAIPLFERCLPLCHEIGDRWLLSNTLASFGYASAQLGKLDAARGYFQEALREAQAIESTPLELFAIVGLAQVLRLEGDKGKSAEIITHVLHHPELNQINRNRAESEKAALIQTGIEARRFETTNNLPSFTILTTRLLK